MTKWRVFVNFMLTHIFLAIYILVFDMPYVVAFGFAIMVFVYMNELAKAK